MCLAYLTAMLVDRGVIGWGEGGTTTVAYFCIMLMFVEGRHCTGEVRGRDNRNRTDTRTSPALNAVGPIIQ